LHRAAVAYFLSWRDAEGAQRLAIGRILRRVHFVVTETLQAPLAESFDVISDPRRRLEWQSSLRSVHVLTPGPPRLGTRWREVTRGGVGFEMEITAFEPPALWSERGHGWLADAQLAVAFKEVGDLTEVRVEVEIAFWTPFKWLSPLVRRLMPGALRADLRRVGSLASGAR
jgi:Polyketide cyclase / dehydrase and lipid transport